MAIESFWLGGEMTELLRGLDKVHKELDISAEHILTVQNLIKAGEMKREHNGNIKLGEGAVLETIYDKDASISIATHAHCGDTVKSHCHLSIKEYLICMKGSFSVSFNHGFRVLKPKDCVAIDDGTIHSVVSLEDNSSLIAICIPEEKAYTRSACE